MKPKPDAPKKKTTKMVGGLANKIERAYPVANKKEAAKKAAGASRDAATKKEMGKQGMAKFGAYLSASDVSGKGRSAAAGRRQAALKGYVGQAGRKAANTGPKKRLPKTM